MRKSSMLFTALLLVIFCATGFATDSDDVGIPSLPDKQSFHIFLLAGQSNMAGRGNVSEKDRKINPKVLMLTKDNKWTYAVDPIHFVSKSAGTGLARSFAFELLKTNKDITIGLVPAAVSGSPIATWEPGALHEKTGTHPYDDAIARTRRAIKDGTLAGILWHQGESDSDEGRSRLYKQNLMSLIQRFRLDLNAAGLPFIIGQLGQFEGNPWSEGRFEVNRAHILVSKELPMVGFVSSKGLTSKEDNSHFDSKSLYEFGRRYADEYLRIIGQNPPSSK